MCSSSTRGKTPRSAGDVARARRQISWRCRRAWRSLGASSFMLGFRRCRDGRLRLLRRRGTRSAALESLRLFQFAARFLLLLRLPIVGLCHWKVSRWLRECRSATALAAVAGELTLERCNTAVQLLDLCFRIAPEHGHQQGRNGE